MKGMLEWLKNESWGEVLEAESAHVKASKFQNILLQKLDAFFPEKKRRISNND